MPIRRTVAVALAFLALTACTARSTTVSGPGHSTVDSQAAGTARVPPARRLVVSMRDNMSNQLYGPVTVDDQAQVDAVAARIDGYPVDRDGPRPCPLTPQQFDLSFRTAGGTEVATATTSGCDDVYLTVAGTSTPLVGAGNLIGFLRDTLHLTWPTP